MSTTTGEAAGGQGLWPTDRLSEELRTSLAGIHDVLRADEDGAEADRRLPEPSVDALRSLDLFAVSSPREVGGWEAAPSLQMEVFETVTRASAAAGWNLFVGAVHTSFVAAYLGDDAAAEIFGAGRPGGRFPVVAGQMQPVGTGRPVDGGMVVSGRYSWGSGISHAEHVLGGAILPEHEGAVPPRFRVYVVPKDRVEVLDNWHVVGVSGSGSYDYAVDEVMVPDGWWFDYPTPTVRRGQGRFAVPVQALIGSAHIGFGLGVGERAFEEMASLAVSKTRTGAGGSIADSEVFQRQLGRTYLELRAARDRGAQVLDQLGSAQEAGVEVGPPLVAEIRAVATWVTEVAVSCANVAMRYSGGTAIRSDSPVQRVVREALVAQAHMYATDANYATLGRSLLEATKPVEPTGTFAAPAPRLD